MTTGRVLSAWLGLLVLSASVPDAASRNLDWSEPFNLGAPINSPFREGMGTLSKDGTTLYFSSTRPCGAGDSILDENIWVSEWNAADARWADPRCLSINADGFQDNVPALSRDQHWMYFVSDRPGSFGSPGSNGRDIWVSRREHVHDNEGWSEPFNAGPILNSSVADAAPTYFENEEGGAAQLFFGSNRSGTFDIWIAEVLGGAGFGPPRRVQEVSTTHLNETGASVTHKGLTLFFARGSGGIADIYSSTREHVDAPWSEAVSMDAVNTAFNEQQPAVTSDGESLFFASNRPGPFGTNLDLWVSTRTKRHGHNAVQP